VDLGRIYEDRHTLGDPRWFGSITVYDDPDAFEIRKRSEQRLGEMMDQQPKALPGRKPKIGSTGDPISLESAGIDKNLADRGRVDVLVERLTAVSVTAG
jgi:hypothetical protein